jgi:GMP synthase (glutamine-hydrolysing)
MSTAQAFDTQVPDGPVVVLDMGSQYAHLIVRKIRELQVYAELLPHNITAQELAKHNPRGIILSGGPASVYAPGSPTIDPKILTEGTPVLGICYGFQLMAQILGGRVQKADKREYGATTIQIDLSADILQGLAPQEKVWMSHGDKVIALPPRFRALAHTDNSPLAAAADSSRSLYGLQFHPEVAHTPRGSQILHNFIYGICKAQPNWSLTGFIEQKTSELRNTLGHDKVLCALSGGVDSSVTAALINRAVGGNLTCVFVDHGLLRKGEAEQVDDVFRHRLGINLIHVEAKDRFLKRLEHVSDPEAKRRAVGREFIRVFEEEASRLGGISWLAQGTLYPDVIESAGTTGPASRIKTHHNVGGLPSKMRLKLVEPLRLLYKDEVRQIGRLLGLPEEIVARHPFPGPGLAVRIMGKVTPDKLLISREASAIVEEELKTSGLYDSVWQAFAVVGDDKWVGVKGDERSLGYVVTIRLVQSLDAMTADWVLVPREVADSMSSRITNEVPGVAMVAMAISSKPPSTIEPC